MLQDDEVRSGYKTHNTEKQSVISLVTLIALLFGDF